MSAAAPLTYEEKERRVLRAVKLAVAEDGGITLRAIRKRTGVAADMASQILRANNLHHVIARTKGP